MIGRPIPTTVVEKVDPFTPSYGEVPGTMAYEQRQADAEPDVVMGQDPPAEKTTSEKGASDALPVPITKVTRVDSSPRHGDVPGTEAHEKRKGDAAPDVVEEQDDVPGTR